MDSQSYPEFKWNKAKEDAAHLLADDILTDEEIAQQAGVTRRTLTSWKQHPEFQERLRSHRKEIEDKVLSQGIAAKGNRVRAMTRRWNLMHQVIAERAASPEMQDVPGGRTGLLVQTVKGIGKGHEYREVKEYAVDTGLLKELRELEKQASQELGHWTEKKELSGPGGKELPIAVIEVVREPDRGSNGHQNGAGSASV